jgi:MSHA biogenesis protein MshN
MSLVNKMLRDLDARHAGTGERAGLPMTITPLSARQEQKSTLGIRQLGAVLAVAGLAAAAWLVYPGYLQLPGMFSLVTPPQALPVAPTLPPAAPVIPAPPAPVVPVEVAAAAADPIPSFSELRLEADLKRPPVALESAEPPKKEKSAEKKPMPEPKVVAKAEAKKPDSALPIAKAPVVPVVPVVPAVLPAALPREAEAPRVEKQVNPGSALERAEAEYRRAVQAQRQGATDEAITKFRSALDEHSEHAAARQALAAVLIDLKRYDEAEDLLRRGTEIASTRLASTLALARLKVERGQSAAALDLLVKNSVIGERSADYQGFAGALLNRAGRYREAVDRYQSATRIAPAEARWWAGLGIALEADGKPAEARDAYLRARALPGLPAELLQHIDSRLR